MPPATARGVDIGDEVASRIDALVAEWKALAVPEEIIAGALGTDVRGLARWRRGSVPQTRARARLAELDALYGRLLETFTEGGAVEWLGTDNPYLGRVKPAEILLAGRIDRLRDALEALDDGVFV